VSAAEDKQSEQQRIVASLASESSVPVELTAGARITGFLPILIFRKVREMLRRRWGSRRGLGRRRGECTEGLYSAERAGELLQDQRTMVEGGWHDGAGPLRELSAALLHHPA